MSYLRYFVKFIIDMNRQFLEKRVPFVSNTSTAFLLQFILFRPLKMTIFWTLSTNNFLDLINIQTLSMDNLLDLINGHFLDHLKRKKNFGPYKPKFLRPYKRADLINGHFLDLKETIFGPYKRNLFEPYKRIIF